MQWRFDLAFGARFHDLNFPSQHSRRRIEVAQLCLDARIVGVDQNSHDRPAGTRL